MAGGGGQPTPQVGGKKSVDFQINMIPMIDLLSVLISFLLMTSVWTQIAKIDVKQSPNLPSDEPVPPPDEEVQAAMDEAALREIPRIAKRTGYLALLANLSMLSGLLGTVSGLIVSFGAVSGESVDPSQKARILAEGISEAMNCTAFGLIVAIIGLVGYAVLNGKTQTLEDDINEASVQVLNLVVTNRQKVNRSGIGG